MASKKKTASKEREEILHRIWMANATKLAERLESTPAAELEAATLNVARQFLSDNGINSDSMRQSDPSEGPMGGVTAVLAEIDLPGLLEGTGRDMPSYEMPEKPRRMPR